MFSKRQQQNVAQRLLCKAIAISNSKKTDVFFDYSPHVHGLYITIYSSGWTENNHADKTFDIYFDRDEATVDSRIDEVEKHLDEILKNA